MESRRDKSDNVLLNSLYQSAEVGMTDPHTQDSGSPYHKEAVRHIFDHQQTGDLGLNIYVQTYIQSNMSRHG